MASTSLVASLSSFVRGHFEKYALLLSNGVIVDGSIDEGVLLKVTRLVKTMCDKVRPHYYVVQKKLLVYRVTEHVFLVLLASKFPGDDDLRVFLGEFASLYAAALAKAYPKPPTTLGEMVRLVVVSIAQDLGPEPLGWAPPDASHDLVLDVSMKSLLLLAGELEGASKAVLSYRPFPSSNAVGIIYLFDVPDEAARGGAYDSCISILVDYENRGVAYQKAEAVEKVCRKYAGACVQNGVDWLKANASTLAEGIRSDLASVALKAEPLAEEVRDKMLESIGRLRDVTRP
ncbi:MAG: hypothetical protein Kow0069_06280 [Promethearchaeota archaeon]